MNPKQKLDELYAVKRSIESKEFQDYVMKPLYEELEKMKKAYDCESLRELAALKGKRTGLMMMIKIFKGIEADIKNLKYEIENNNA